MRRMFNIIRELSLPISKASLKIFTEDEDKRDSECFALDHDVQVLVE